jgi:hypothetical protein
MTIVRDSRRTYHISFTVLNPSDVADSVGEGEENSKVVFRGEAGRIQSANDGHAASLMDIDRGALELVFDSREVEVGTVGGVTVEAEFWHRVSCPFLASKDSQGLEQF